jgi:hypothetical protein
MRPRLAAVLSLAAALGLAAPAGAEFVVGVGTHFGQNRGDVTRSLELMREAGVRAFRDELYWALVETRPGVLSLDGATARVANALDAAPAAGLAPILVLDYGNLLHGGGFPLTDASRRAFVAYAQFAATTYRGKVRHYEVWNEWNAGMGQGNATAAMKSVESYLPLLAAAYAAVKQADPTAVVIGGAVDGNVAWTERLVELGGMKHMDVLSIHPYMFHAGPDGTPERLVRYLEDLGRRLAARHGGIAPPVYITETGWPTFASRLGVSPEQAADYLVRSYLGVRTVPFVQGMWWYELQNSGTDPRNLQHNFGLTDANLEPKPAYHALRAVAPLVAPSESGERVPTANGEWLVRLRHADGSTVLGLWTPARASKRVELWLRVPADVQSSVSGGASGYAKTARVRLRPGWNRLDLEVSGAPVLIMVPRLEATVGELRDK